MNRLQFLKKLAGLCIAVPLAKCLGKETPIKRAFKCLRVRDYFFPYLPIRTRVPDDFLADFPAVEKYIDERLPYMVGKDAETEFGILYGDTVWRCGDKTTIADLIARRHDAAWTFVPDSYDWEKAKLSKG